MQTAVCPDLEKPLVILMAIQRWMCKEIGKFYQNKNNGKAIGYENRMLKVRNRYGDEFALLQSYTEAKEFWKAVKKSVDMVDMFFPSQPSFIYYSGSQQSIATIKKAKEMLKWARLSCRHNA
jgi:hypothetical protein